MYIFIFEVKIVATYAIATTTFSMRGFCPEPNYSKQFETRDS